jgi:predicted nucleotide-binding protein
MSIIETRFYKYIFLHFFDIHFLESKDALRGNIAFEKELRLATRLAVAASEKVYIPAASYAESSICHKVIQELKELFEFGVIVTTGNSPNWSTFKQEKLCIYKPDSVQVKAYSSLDLDDYHPPFSQRSRSATADICNHWLSVLNEGEIFKFLTQGTDIKLPRKFEYQWEKIPKNLGSSAFIVDHVLNLFDPQMNNLMVKNRLHKVINEGYFDSFTQDFKAGLVIDLVYLDPGFSFPSYGLDLPYKKLINQLRKVGLLPYISSCEPTQLLEVKHNSDWQECVYETLKNDSFEFISRNNILLSKDRCIQSFSGSPVMKSLRSFIVHGHDDKLILELKDYLQNTLHFPEPIVLFQQPNSGRTIIEKFEHYSKQVDVAFVLMTPDDLGGAVSEGDQKYRARQNVVFELGYFVAKFGRTSGRILLLHKGNLEIPSDLAGVVYIDVSGGINSAGEKLRRELDCINI